MFVLYNSGQGDNAQHVYRISLCSVCCCHGYSIYCYDLLCLAGTHVAAFTGTCGIYTYNSRVDVRRAECACGKAMWPVRTMFMHACSLYENVVNGTKVALYKVVNTTQLEILVGSKIGLGFGLWPLHLCKERCSVCMGCDFDVNAYLPLVC